MGEKEKSKLLIFDDFSPLLHVSLLFCYIFFVLEALEIHNLILNIGNSTLKACLWCVVIAQP